MSELQHPRHPHQALQVNAPFGLSDDLDEEDVPEALHLGWYNEW
jgi:hypothetical protein